MTNFDAEIEAWRLRQLKNLEWKDRYMALKSSLKPLREASPQQLLSASPDDTSSDQEADYPPLESQSSKAEEEIGRLQKENEALRVKCDVLLEALEQERSRQRPQMRQSQSMVRLRPSATSFF